MADGILYLVPTPLHEEGLAHMPADCIHRLCTAQHIITERIRTTRRLIRTLSSQADIDAIRFYEMDKHDARVDDGFLAPLRAGEDVLLVSEAGAPCLGDPGEQYVQRAHASGIQVRPLSGPSSIWLALIGSGFDAERFSYHGYLPRDRQQLRQALRSIERSAQSGITQIWIETPYRSQAMLSACRDSLSPDSRLCIAENLTSRSEKIRSYTLRRWAQESAELRDALCVFLLAGLSSGRTPR